MKRIIILACVALLFGTLACNSRKKERELEKKQSELNQKEQQLLLKERKLQLQEEELSKKEQKIDSVILEDTIAFTNNPALVGSWAVRMTCTEATCPGSAVGDTKNEQWDISYQNNHVIAKAMAGNKLVRVYSGLSSSANTLELIEHRDTALIYDTRMVVRLRMRDKKNIEGQREIIRENNCKIVYALQMEKQ